jgi:outer membrane assembly lipoprotein YfiO
MLAGCASDRWQVFAGAKNLTSAHAGKEAETADKEKTAKDAEAEKGTTLAGFKWYEPATWFTPKPPEGAAETLVLRGGQMVPDTAHNERSTADLAGALELHRRGDYATAEKVFHAIADDSKNSPAIAEEARFYEAECLRRQEEYPKACDTYHKMLLDFPSGTYREQAVQRMFDIANFWLEDTRKEMEAYEDVKAGKQWFVLTPWFHFEKAKPFIDQEGRAMEALEHVRNNDRGPLAEKALFLAGTVRFWREDYRDADSYFSQLVELYPNSKLAPRATELGIVAKYMSTGGADYDGRKVAEARKLINTAMQNYPTLAKEKQEFFMHHIVNCNHQQAEKDFKIAEFYRRTGHPGSAYFYYEIVRRRYPGTKYADEATHRMHEIHDKVEKEQQKAPPGGPLNAPAVTPPGPVVPVGGVVETPGPLSPNAGIGR